MVLDFIYKLDYINILDLSTSSKVSHKFRIVIILACTLFPTQPKTVCFLDDMSDEVVHHDVFPSGNGYLVDQHVYAHENFRS